MTHDPDPHPHMTIPECIAAALIIVFLIWLMVA